MRFLARTTSSIDADRYLGGTAGVSLCDQVVPVCPKDHSLAVTSKEHVMARDNWMGSSLRLIMKLLRCVSHTRISSRQIHPTPSAIRPDPPPPPPLRPTWRDWPIRLSRIGAFEVYEVRGHPRRGTLI